MTPGIIESTAERPSLWAEASYAAVEIERAIYPLEAVVAAAYKFTGRTFVWLQSSGTDGRFVAFLRPKNPNDDKSELVSSFTNELLDQTLRHQLDQRFTPLRTLIAAQAFAEGNLLDAVLDANKT